MQAYQSTVLVVPTTHADILATVRVVAVLRRGGGREERKRERERERRLDARDAHGVKKSKLTRDRERDISERIALGQVRCLHLWHERCWQAA